MSMKPNETCDDSFCCKRQQEFKKRKAEEDAREAERKKTEKVEEKKPIKHVPNKYGICVVDESEIVEDKTEVAPGIKYAYEAAAKEEPKIEDSNLENESIEEAEESLEELRKRMQNL